MKYAGGDDEELVLHIAYRACPCGCGFDADAWIDDTTGEVELFVCPTTGDEIPVVKES